MLHHTGDPFATKRAKIFPPHDQIFRIIFIFVKNHQVKIDKVKNDCRGKAGYLSAEDSKVSVLVIPTEEELMIARDTKALV